MPLQTWWGETALPAGPGRVWHIGPLRLELRRGAGEVVVRWWGTQDALDESLVVDESEGEPFPAAQEERLVVDCETVTLEPVLCDLAVVARSEEPLTLPVGATVTAYVSSPVFVRLRCGTAVWEAPTHRLSDTWFGPNTREGELAYASRTHLKLDPSNVLRRPHRAFTPVVLDNQGDGPMTVDRIRVPVPRLTLYAGIDAMWTSTVRLERRRGDEALVRVLPGSPPECAGGTLLAEPRRFGEPHAVLRVFSLLEKMR